MPFSLFFLDLALFFALHRKKRRMKLHKLFSPTPTTSISETGPWADARSGNMAGKRAQHPFQKQQSARSMAQVEQELLAYQLGAAALERVLQHNTMPHLSSTGAASFRIKANGAIVMNRKPSLPVQWWADDANDDDDDEDGDASDASEERIKRDLTTPCPDIATTTQEQAKKDTFLQASPLRVPLMPVRRSSFMPGVLSTPLNRCSSLPTITVAYHEDENASNTIPREEWASGSDDDASGKDDAAVPTDRKLQILLGELDAVQEEGTRLLTRCQQLELAQLQLKDQLEQRDLVIATLKNHIQSMFTV
ncbi:hypothetical protein BC940DRAFT_300255 [Gongronella butleri]|nr:hypothetical protein BC940DRAFT_300255 [Gongronella butleri]